MFADIPEGFAPFKIAMGFLAANGPLYGKWDGTHLLMGFRVEPRHCNPGQVAHGGDACDLRRHAPSHSFALPGQDRHGLPADDQPGLRLPGARAAGLLVEGRAEIVRMTRNLLFAQGLATADGEPCLRANGIFKIKSARDAGNAANFSIKSLFDFP